VQGNPRRLIGALAALEFGSQLPPANLPLLLESESKVEGAICQYCSEHARQVVTPTQIAEWLYTNYGLEVAPETIGRILKRLAISMKHTRRGTEYMLGGGGW
jgi:hypothetical protein